MRKTVISLVLLLAVLLLAGSQSAWAGVKWKPNYTAVWEGDIYNQPGYSELQVGGDGIHSFMGYWDYPLTFDESREPVFGGYFSGPHVCYISIFKIQDGMGKFNCGCEGISEFMTGTGTLTFNRRAGTFLFEADGTRPFSITDDCAEYECPEVFEAWPAFSVLGTRM